MALAGLPAQNRGDSQGRRAIASLAAVACTCLPAYVGAAAPQPGLYTVTLQLVMPHTTLQLPVRAHRLCLAAGEIAYGSAYAVSETGRFCDISQFQQHGATLRYDFVCDTAGPARMVGHAEGRRDPRGYEIRMSGRYVPARPGQESFVQIVRAQRSGDCTPR